MDKFLILAPDDQKLAIEQTAARVGWVASSVEKDFWVCWMLRQLFTLPDLTPHLIFKGGTSLSKVWKLIDRFSEDIDLTIDRAALGFATLHRYVRPIVKIEFGSRSDPWPARESTVRPIIADHFPQAFTVPDCTVTALAPERTFWEKAMLLHEETYRPADKSRRPRMARHYYDLYRLIEHGVAASAAADRTLFKDVAGHRQVFFAQSWVDYTTLVPGALRLLPLPEQEAGWHQDYSAMQGEMFSTAPPIFDIVLQLVKQFESEFNATACTQQ